MRALHRKLWRDVFHLRGQLAAVVLVIASGIALFTTLRSMHGYLSGAQERYYREERFAEIFARLQRAPRSVERAIAAIPGVAAVQTRVVADVLLEVPGLREPATGRLISLPDGAPPVLNGLRLRQGRHPAAGMPDEVLVSDAFLRANDLRPGDSIGAILHGRWRRLLIAGSAISPEYIYEIRGAGDVFPDNRRFGVLWIGGTTLEAAFDLQGAFNDVALTLAPGASEKDVITRLDRILEAYGGLGAYGREDHVSHRFVSDEIAETQVTSILVPAIFLGVTAFLLHLVLSRLAGTQREQIAVLKAFGYRSGEVARHYLGLALVPVVAGSIAGAALGLWFASALAGVYARFYQFPEVGFRPDPAVVVVAMLVGGGAALAGSLGAVRRVLALAPAEAMKPEAPARFRAGMIESAGLMRMMTPTVRMIARHLERRPVKAALSALGLALAVSIVVVGLHMFDAVARLRSVHFEGVQREDVAVFFRDPIGGAVRHELERMPGVLRVEPIRVLAARLRNAGRGDISRRTALTGLEEGGELRRIVDRRLRAHWPRRDGLLLTTKLAEVLHVGPGDSLLVEILEGTRPVLEVRVVGVVDELIGTSAYMERHALHRLVREGEVWSGAFLRVETGQVDALYARLERLPAVSTVTVAEASRAGFDRTIAESFRISLLATVGFACVIAFGMVYNGARIALSERGRELASLRVLGFTRDEVSVMLLGEQALLILLALAPGLLIGYGLSLLLVWRFDSELFRIPLVVSGATAVASCSVVVASGVISGLAVRHRVNRLDLIEVLKARE